MSAACSCRCHSGRTGTGCRQNRCMACAAPGRDCYCARDDHDKCPGGSLCCCSPELAGELEGRGHLERSRCICREVERGDGIEPIPECPVHAWMFDDYGDREPWECYTAYRWWL